MSLKITGLTEKLNPQTIEEQRVSIKFGDPPPLAILALMASTKSKLPEGTEGFAKKLLLCTFYNHYSVDAANFRWLVVNGYDYNTVAQILTITYKILFHENLYSKSQARKSEAHEKWLSDEERKFKLPIVDFATAGYDGEKDGVEMDCVERYYYHILSKAFNAWKLSREGAHSKYDPETGKSISIIPEAKLERTHVGSNDYCYTSPDYLIPLFEKLLPENLTRHLYIYKDTIEHINHLKNTDPIPPETKTRPAEASDEDWNSWLLTNLCYAALHGKKKWVKNLSEKVGEEWINRAGWFSPFPKGMIASPIIQAIYGGYPKVVKYLLKRVDVVSVDPTFKKLEWSKLTCDVAWFIGNNPHILMGENRPHDTSLILRWDEYNTIANQIREMLALNQPSNEPHQAASSSSQ